MKRPKVIVASILLLCIAAVIWFGISFAPGSYPYTEQYEFDVSEEKLINAINTLRDKEPDLKVPDSYEMTEGRQNANYHWYHFYIYYSGEEQILNCWVRANSTKTTNLALVSIGKPYGKWKSLNRDFNRFENKEQQKKFQERFVNKVRQILKDN